MSNDLLEVVQAIADLENVETEVKTLSVNINGDTYNVDPTSVTASTSGTCDPGFYSDAASCGRCRIPYFSHLYIHKIGSQLI